MGQKINPIGFRIGNFLTWKSRWWAPEKLYREYVVEDSILRQALMTKLRLAGIVSVEIERLTKSIVIALPVARPGVVIGRGGSGLEELKRFILTTLKKSRENSNLPFEDLEKIKIDIKVVEVHKPELSARLVAERIVSELERRMPHRRVVARAIERVVGAGAEGVKVVLSGRIGGADIARVEKFKKGSIPAQTLREDIDYAGSRALLKKGCVGVKVWIHRKDQ